MKPVVWVLVTLLVIGLLAVPASAQYGCPGQQYGQRGPRMPYWGPPHPHRSHCPPQPGCLHPPLIPVEHCGRIYWVVPSPSWRFHLPRPPVGYGGYGGYGRPHGPPY
jgi:hypothetical protein